MFFSQPESYEEYRKRSEKLDQEYIEISADYYARLDEHRRGAEHMIEPVVLTFGIFALVSWVPQMFIVLVDSLITGLRLAINRLEEFDIRPSEENQYIPFSGL